MRTRTNKATNLDHQTNTVRAEVVMEDKVAITAVTMRILKSLPMTLLVSR